MPGTYNEQVDISISGTLTDYITFTSHDPNNQAVITNAPHSLKGTIRIIGADYNRLQNLNINNTSYSERGSCVYISGNAQNNIIDNCSLSSVSDNWWAGGVVIYDGPANTLIQDNHISTTADGYDGPFGVLLYYVGGGTVIRNNTIIGGFFDGIGGAPNFSINGGPYHDADINDNYIEGVNGDGIESEGGNINVRIWGNEIRDPELMGIAIGATIIGPLHIFRNTIQEHLNGAIKMGHDSTGTTYIYHNTIFTTYYDACGPVDFAGPGVGNVISRNNIYQVGKWIIETCFTDLGGNDFDYDSMFTTNTTRFVKWFGDWHLDFSSFQTETGQELHAISADSEFVDPANHDLELQITSPCIDQGIILPGFNDANSLWPYRGTAPDMGAFEYVPREPLATTLDATSIYTTTATLNGIIDEDGGEPCQYSFEYDVDSGEPYSNSTSWEGSKTSGQSFSSNISGLSPGYTYYFRALAKNSSGTSYGSEFTFTTEAEFISFTITDYNDDGILFDALDPGETGQADNGGIIGAVTIIIEDETNIDVDIYVKGNDFTGDPAGTIPVGCVTYDSDDDPAGAFTLTDSYGEPWYSVGAYTRHVRQVYYWLNIPPGQLAGSYTSIFFFLVAASP
jgi:hypothetical protein